MDIQLVQKKEMYSEVYGILNLLGNSYISKLPKKLYELIKNEKKDDYTPIYTLDKPLNEQNVKIEAISMIALFHLNYWCNTEEEKQGLRDIFRKNQEIEEAKLREKYNPDDIFKKRVNNTKVIADEPIETPIENTSMVEYKKESFIRRIINKIKNLFRKK